MTTTTGTTGQTFLEIDMENYLISFPAEGGDGNYVKNTLTLRIFLRACSFAEYNLGEHDLERSKTYAKFFMKFLEVI